MKQRSSLAARAAWSDTWATLAKTNTSAFATLLGKVLPLQVTGENGGSIKMEDTTPTHDRRKAALALLLAKEP